MVTSLKCSDVIAMDVTHKTKKDQKKKKGSQDVSFTVKQKWLGILEQESVRGLVSSPES